MLARLGEGNQQSKFEVSVDGTRVPEPGGIQAKLCGVLESIGLELCLREYVTFDMAGDGFRISVRLLGLV